MTDTIFGVIAQEEVVIDSMESDSVDYTVAVENAIDAIEAADKSEDLIFEADKFAEKVQSAISVEEAILKDGGVSKEVAKMATISTVMLAKESGFPTTVSIEDNIVDASSSMVVAIEEKRNIVKKIYDSVVIFFKKFVNMIKKAFAKVIMTLNGNEGSLKKLKKKFENLKKDAYTIKKYDVESIFDKYPTYTYSNSKNKFSSFMVMINEQLSKGDEVLAATEKTFNVEGNINNLSNAGTVLRKPFTEAFKEVQNYVGNKKTSLFGDEYTGEIIATVISYTGTYVRCVIIAGMNEDKPLVKIKKIKLNSSDSYDDAGIKKSDYVALLEKAISANKNIKKFTDSAFKDSNKALDQAAKLAKTADKNDNADESIVKIQIMATKVFGTAGYGIAMDRYKVIRETIKVGYNIIDTIKENEKESKKDSTNS